MSWIGIQYTASVPLYKTLLTKPRELRKLVVIINLLIVGVVFTSLSFKRENLFMVLSYYSS
jgi:hypothetical protein